MQGWDVALAVLQSFRDAMPQASTPDAANGQVSDVTRHEDGLLNLACTLTVHLVVMDVVATSYQGTVLLIPPGCQQSFPLLGTYGKILLLEFQHSLVPCIPCAF